MITGTYPEISAADAVDRIEAEGLLRSTTLQPPDLNVDKLNECLVMGWEPVYGVFRRNGGPILGAPGIQITIKNHDAFSLVPVSLGPKTIDLLRRYPTLRIEYELAAKAA